MYHAPTELQDALGLLQQQNSKIVAGGTDVYPSMQQGQQPTTFLDVTRIGGLREISVGSDGVRMGAAVTWSDLIAADLPPSFDALKEAAREVGSVQIQNAGTIAGNLCNASPAADGVPPLLALDAALEVASAARGTRVLPLSAFLLGVRHTALAEDELVTAILVPPTPPGMGSAFEKLGSRRYLVISITMVAALVACDCNGRITDVRVAVGACSPVARRLGALERDLTGQAISAVKVTPLHLADLSPIDDVRGTGAFRLDVVAEQCERAIRRAARS